MKVEGDKRETRKDESGETKGPPNRTQIPTRGARDRGSIRVDARGGGPPIRACREARWWRSVSATRSPSLLLAPVRSRSAPCSRVASHAAHCACTMGVSRTGSRIAASLNAFMAHQAEAESGVPLPCVSDSGSALSRPTGRKAPVQGVVRLHQRAIGTAGSRGSSVTTRITPNAVTA